MGNRLKIRLLLAVNSRHNKRRKPLFPRSQLQEEKLVERNVVEEDESPAQEIDQVMSVVQVAILVKCLQEVYFRFSLN